MSVEGVGTGKVCGEVWKSVVGCGGSVFGCREGEGIYGQKFGWCGGFVRCVWGCEEVLGEVCEDCTKALVINLEL